MPFLDVAGCLNTRLVRTLLHDAAGCPSIEEAERNIRAALPALRERDMTLDIENHDSFSVGELRGTVERIGNVHVGICLDPVNNLSWGESTQVVFAALGGIHRQFPLQGLHHSAQAF